MLVPQSCMTLYNPMDCNPPGHSVHGDSPGKNTGVGCHLLLQGIFSYQRSNPGLPHCSQILYCLSQQFSSVQLLSHVQFFEMHGLQHTGHPCPSPTPGAYSNSCPSSQWCHPTISSSFVPFSSHLQSFQGLGSYPMSHLFASGGQSIAVSASASVLPMNIQDWFPLGWTDWISLQSKGLSKVFSNTTVQKYQFFGIKLSL